MNLLKPIELNRTNITKVRKWSDIKDEALELIKFIDEKQDKFEGNFSACYALHHVQVNKEPYNFFVIAKNVHGSKKNQFISRVIINPKIVEAPERIEYYVPEKDFNTKKDDSVDIGFKNVKKLIPNLIDPIEGCMSFPNRTEKHVDRFFKIKVQYQVPLFWGFWLKTKTEWVEGLKAHIFQHEIDHGNGITIYYDK